MITVGVEEEYLLLDPVTALPVALAEEVRAAAGLAPIAETGEVQSELLQAQVEVATPICSTLDEVGGHLLRLRHAVATAAASVGCRVAACGAAPLRGTLPVPVTQNPRYLSLQILAPRLVDENLINGMHVHAAVPDRETGVAVLNRIRTWLPVLVAMGANSPLWEGHDTGFASWRTVIFGRWPVSGPPPSFTGAADYDRRIEVLVAAGAVNDVRQLYWQARLSERYPTIEVRCLDVQLTAEDAVMFAGLVRALVSAALRAERAGEPLGHCPPELLRAADWHAARHGLDSTLIDPRGHSRRAGEMVAALLEHVEPDLAESGDTREVSSLVHRLLREGTPADRQRRAMATGGLPALTDLITGQEVEL
ncbi:glutamate--cysteine ligase [Streptomyces sp. NBC_01190]|uniref:carboxylate-amine ligase n=1 Tax=Streptomyces sp. NBC_01190 TaxID=2903767 RepID=UPI00386D42E1|nr:glutamate--cysteine ligase [Streptomyces sp. NBC_01190]